MAGVLRSNLAERDLVEIWLFIAENNPDAADRFLDLLAQKCEMLAESPGMGRPRADLVPGIRSFPVGRYVIFYRTVEQGIEIARVLSAYRDIETLFRS